MGAAAWALAVPVAGFSVGICRGLVCTRSMPRPAAFSGVTVRGLVCAKSMPRPAAFSGVTSRGLVCACTIRASVVLGVWSVGAKREVLARVESA
ncbi:hypothetical protein D3C72_1900640 [compost metagenome]